MPFLISSTNAVIKLDLQMKFEVGVILEKELWVFFSEKRVNFIFYFDSLVIKPRFRQQLKPPRRPKKKGQREEDLKDFPQEEVEHDVPHQELMDAFGEGNWKSMPDKIFWQLRFEPARWIAEKHVVKVYVGTGGDYQDEFLRGIYKLEETLKDLPPEERLKVFLTDGEVPIDNSASERALRNFTVGRKNWVTINTIRGAQTSAVIYSITETAVRIT